MFNKILIANRGEIALRIMRACREMGIGTVAIYSEVDRDSLHVRTADEAICVGPPPARDSYLNEVNIIGAALITGAEAIHPGYGFLAENTRFVEICESHGLKFIGPSADIIALMGNKAKARLVVEKAGVPVLPGSGIVEDEKEALFFAREVGFPVILKASGGGGGKGMRVANDYDELKQLFNIAKLEAKSFFNDDRIYIEKYMPHLRHVEVQVVCDEFGNAVHFGERDCSVQRRHQKIVEEAPCIAVDLELRNFMGDMALRAARAVDYKNVGTVEFLLDEEKREFYFIEMNTRIQVEHPVTEMVYNIDLIKEMIRVAAGMKLEYKQRDIMPEGHSLECRVNAEDAASHFSPSSGKITMLDLPGGPGIRVDTHLFQGCVITPFYDSLLAKVISKGATREEAIHRMSRALREFRIEGVVTNINFLRRILNDAFFAQGDINTSYLEKNQILFEFAKVPEVVPAY
ncbi:MAG: acetyl-CoA carboxylase biotin carboxylase subunit [Chloroflexi bacterium]|nr:acetyl-CoA carboxylase biotin carboxylase subunit [Chloroflexota bacterium]